MEASPAPLGAPGLLWARCGASSWGTAAPGGGQQESLLFCCKVRLSPAVRRPLASKHFRAKRQVPTFSTWLLPPLR